MKETNKLNNEQQTFYSTWSLTIKDSFQIILNDKLTKDKETEIKDKA